jgi:soluble lytic murein transglycosylase-like protein
MMKKEVRARPARAPFPDLSAAVLQQESGGRAGVAGPQTPYGQAFGLMQVQDGTGKEMAQKLGLPWRPDLMRGTDEAAASYQRAIGEAYLREGLERHGGDPRKALMYYHGGPDQQLWGPKTRRYADQVLARMRGR